MINVVIADHDAIFGAGLAALLGAEEDFRILDHPTSPEQMVNTLENLRPRVLILSSRFQPFLDQLRDIVAEHNIGVLMLCSSCEPASEFMRMGARGIVYRSAKPKQLVNAVRQLARGRSFVQIADASETENKEDVVGAQVRKQLSDRELRIIAAVVQGYKNREIAVQLCTTEHAVKNCLRGIFDKMGVFGRLELALFVMAHPELAEAAAALEGEPVLLSS